MDSLIQIFLPLVMFLMMTIIGTELAWLDFRQVTARLWLVIVAAVGQLLMLPLLVYMALSVFGLNSIVPLSVAAAMFIMATGPGGGLSNILVSHARGNVALSIVLTTTASLLSLLSMPLMMIWVLPLVLSDVALSDSALIVPVNHILAQLVFFMALPISVGMFLRHKKPALIECRQKALQRFNSVLLIVMVVYSFSVEGGADASLLLQALPYALVFMSVSAGLAFLFSLLLRQNWQDRKALLLEFGVHSAAISTLLIVTVFQQLTWLAFIGAVAILQMLLALLIILYKTFVFQSVEQCDTLYDNERV